MRDCRPNLPLTIWNLHPGQRPSMRRFAGLFGPILLWFLLLFAGLLPHDGAAFQSNVDEHVKDEMIRDALSRRVASYASRINAIDQWINEFMDGSVGFLSLVEPLCALVDPAAKDAQALVTALFELVTAAEQHHSLLQDIVQALAQSDTVIPRLKEICDSHGELPATSKQYRRGHFLLLDSLSHHKIIRLQVRIFESYLVKEHDGGLSRSSLAFDDRFVACRQRLFQLEVLKTGIDSVSLRLRGGDDGQYYLELLLLRLQEAMQALEQAVHVHAVLVRGLLRAAREHKAGRRADYTEQSFLQNSLVAKARAVLSAAHFWLQQVKTFVGGPSRGGDPERQRAAQRFRDSRQPLQTRAVELAWLVEQSGRSWSLDIFLAGRGAKEREDVAWPGPDHKTEARMLAWLKEMVPFYEEKCQSIVADYKQFLLDPAAVPDGDSADANAGASGGEPSSWPLVAHLSDRPISAFRSMLRYLRALGTRYLAGYLDERAGELLRAAVLLILEEIPSEVPHQLRTLIGIVGRMAASWAESSPSPSRFGIEKSLVKVEKLLRLDPIANFADSWERMLPRPMEALKFAQRTMQPVWRLALDWTERAFRLLEIDLGSEVQAEPRKRLQRAAQLLLEQLVKAEWVLADCIARSAQAPLDALQVGVERLSRLQLMADVAEAIIVRLGGGSVCPPRPAFPHFRSRGNRSGSAPVMVDGTLDSAVISASLDSGGDGAGALVTPPDGDAAVPMQVSWTSEGD